MCVICVYIRQQNYRKNILAIVQYFLAKSIVAILGMQCWH